LSAYFANEHRTKDKTQGASQIYHREPSSPTALLVLSV